MTPDASNSSDDFVLVLKLLAASAGVIVLGPIGIVAAFLPWMAAWYSGSLFACAIGLVASVLLTSALFASGILPAVALALADRLRGPLATLDIPGLVDAWLDLAGDPWTAISLSSIGIGVGAVVRLLFEDAMNSGTKGLVRRRLRPAPVVARSKRKVGLLPAAAGDKTILGVNWRTGSPAYITDSALNNHVLLVGTTGGGKTVTALNIIEAHIERGLPVLILDGKGDAKTGRQVMTFAREHGRKAYMFHHGEHASPLEGCAYNPFAKQDFSALADMVVTLHDWREPYYQILAKGFVQTVFKVALATGKPIDLLTIQELMSVRSMVAAVRQNAKAVPNAQALLDEIHDQMSAEKAGVEGLRALIRNLGRSSVAHLFDTSSSAPVLQLSRARREGAVAYFALPALMYPDLSKAIGKLVINDARITLSQSEGPWLIVLDELSTFVGQQVLHLINQGRSFGARLVLSGQSFADLEASVVSGGAPFLNQILASVNTLIVHQLNSPADAELASQYAGTFQKIEVTAQVIEGVATGVGSARGSREFVVSPDDFKELALAEAYILSKKYGTRTKFSARLSKIVRRRK
jgi:type IV secretory pathway TraG/TraD family ATPase VirD4